ncbi:hypothetical protein GOZ78_01975 [Agrobacterium vitis]|uniref:Uncharacterized protein n=1 Tax=Agrobacterium vitis TaxID=373 RepID=A0ABD6G7A2_AGRVI|nr:hypothetical protein [Agrobacterium vitis]MUO77668.1 hypothetical protein [Agrobacterium vitis]MUO93185.1 hypothetical protein [Agrobacterium vitis]MUP04536.1 hypothetical protein [Agrobacterium vitis]MUZ81026.1 hypothetical protein [Agrobacterium vitis]MVA08788.1 hypothetical protein [Agrobacterium vitis]
MHEKEKTNRSTVEIDIVERLRTYRPTDEWGDGVHHTICDEAANEITRLSNELRQSQSALDLAISRGCDHCAENIRHARNMAVRSVICPATSPELLELIAKAKATYDAMSPEEKARHDQAQRESFLRGMMPTGDPRLD